MGKINVQNAGLWASGLRCLYLGRGASHRQAKVPPKEKVMSPPKSRDFESASEFPLQARNRCNF